MPVVGSIVDVFVVFSCSGFRSLLRTHKRTKHLFVIQGYIVDKIGLSPVEVFLLTVPRRFLCYSFFFICASFVLCAAFVWSHFVPRLSIFGASGRMSFIIMAFHVYLYL